MKLTRFFPSLILQNLVALLHFQNFVTLATWEGSRATCGCGSHTEQHRVMFLFLWMRQSAGVGGGLASAQADVLGGPK